MVYQRKKKGFSHYAKKGLKYAGYGIRAYKMAKQIKGLLNVEHKFIDTGVVTDTPINTGQVDYLSGLAQGTTNTTRVGVSIKVTSLYMRLQCVMNSGATTTMLRLIVVKDKENRGSAPAVTDILQSADVRSFISRDTAMRYKILVDKYVTLYTSYPQKVFDIYKKLNHHIKYTGAGGAVANQLEEGLFFLLISDQAMATQPTVLYNSRIRFVDN